MSGADDRRRRPGVLVALTCLLALSACSTDQQAVRPEGAPAPEERTPRYESRTGVPVLMDLPLIGWMFRPTTVVR